MRVTRRVRGNGPHYLPQVGRGTVAISIGAAHVAKARRPCASPGLFLLFEEGKRPGRAEILATLDALPTAVVSHDPGPEGGSTGTGDWLEVLVDGLTFDLVGLAPGPTLSLPPVHHRFGLPPHLSFDGMEAIAVFPGPHITGGAHTVPVIRALAGLGSGLATMLDGVEALCWPPARSAVVSALFARIVDGWLDGGPFPALGFTGLSVMESGALRSEGLSFLIGQEIELVPEIAIDRVGATRLAARIVHELVGAGPLAGSVEVTGEGGRRLLLDPTPGGALIRVMPA